LRGRGLIFAALLLTVVCALAAGPAFAISPAELKPRGYVNDFAGVIEPEWQQRLTRLATLLDQKTKAQIAIVTIPSLDGEPIEDFANALFQAWHIGHKDDQGALLLLAIKDRRSRLEVGYGLEPILPDGFDGSVLREMRPALREGKYGQALYAGSSLLAERIASHAGVKLDDPALPRPPQRHSPQPDWLVVGIVIAVLFFGAPWWMALLGLSRWVSFGGGGGGFGGGFGGYDSGGSGGGFGGFGGGSSGGGGASSGW
jgi:uncharacterized protein